MEQVAIFFRISNKKNYDISDVHITVNQLIRIRKPKENAVKSGMTDLALLKSGRIPFFRSFGFLNLTY